MGMKDQFQDKAQELANQAKKKRGQAQDEANERIKQGRERGSQQGRERGGQQGRERSQSQQEAERAQREEQDRFDADYDA